ncbi:uncharacterized protein LOC129617850 [Condylostylus longicornis]|uniref:uncharacterized protein LOC129617850 n=1 Tax=Condylostylus longicornis TaxID=2530218 RepID=UPI00244E2DFC|nr:uncharacterized protein LOC129617850 [Condylostylus longicornis]
MCGMKTPLTEFFRARSALLGKEVTRYGPANENSAQLNAPYLGQSIDLIGSLWNATTGRLLDKSSGIGAGIDSFFEYLYKAGVLFGDVELANAFDVASVALRKYCHRRGVYFSCDMESGNITPFMFDLLSHCRTNNWVSPYECSWCFLAGDPYALQSYVAYLNVWMKYDALPEDFNVLLGEPDEVNRGYPLRPEFFESTFVMSQAMSGSDTNISEVEVYRDVVLPAYKKFNGTLRTSCGMASQPSMLHL